VFSAKSLGSIIYLAALGSVVAFVAYYWLHHRTRAVVVSLIAFITPLVGVFIGVGLYNEAFTALTIVGTALILAAWFWP
jgi:drug/metabolite transporter (DMT)-like permease